MKARSEKNRYLHSHKLRLWAGEDRMKLKSIFTFLLVGFFGWSQSSIAYDRQGLMDCLGMFIRTEPGKTIVDSKFILIPTSPHPHEGHAKGQGALMFTKGGTYFFPISKVDSDGGFDSNPIAAHYNMKLTFKGINFLGKFPDYYLSLLGPLDSGNELASYPVVGGGSWKLADAIPNSTWQEIQAQTADQPQSDKKFEALLVSEIQGLNSSFTQMATDNDPAAIKTMLNHLAASIGYALADLQTCKDKIKDDKLSSLITYEINQLNTNKRLAFMHSPPYDKVVSKSRERESTSLKAE